MQACAIVGINWGDEGKGRMVDLLSSEFDVVVRYQGGGNAGHTVINDKGKFALHLLPSGIFNPNAVNLLGNGVALDLENLWKEIDELNSMGVTVNERNLKISARASLLLPYHRQLDALEENRLKDKKYGSTKQGIAPFYSDKYQKKTVMAGELLNTEKLLNKLKEILEWKNLCLSGMYGAEKYEFDELKRYIEYYAQKTAPFICDTGEYLKQALNGGKRALFEAQLGALRDIDFGIYPYTTSSNTLASYAPIGSGLPSLKLDSVIGVVKAYSTCVGEGPFVSEMFGTEADKLREAGNEYGAKTGRPRRVGALDLVATKYGVDMQGANYIALTKADVLGYMEKIPVCVKYKLGDVEKDSFPFPTDLDDAKPIIEYAEGWMCDVSKARKWDDLPAALKNYVRMIEDRCACFVKYVSVGPERDSIIIR